MPKVMQNSIANCFGQHLGKGTKLKNHAEKTE
jgi:hypothetical protein